MPESSKLHTEKTILRQYHLRQRKRMERSLVWDLSCRIQRRLLDLTFFSRACTVGLYAPLGNEVDTQMLCEEKLGGGGVVAYPGVMHQNMEYVRYSSDCAWVAGAFGILQPHVETQQYTECVVAPEHFDVVVVPGVAFDRSGSRLGYGKGFYDRYLPQCRAQCVFVGLAYDFQLEDRLPCEGHDVYLDYVVTEKETIECTAVRHCLSD
ncbi:MAG: 5-formyltetrahydrofolate cyclo-ligase [Desulfuromonadaceae bacterium]|nr:5-formyltetrahydrofolate cyclo-ligase [Geobacteraceae bacterium]